jgi:hypothetical protein
MSEREKIHDSQGMYAERPIIPRATSSRKMGIANGTIGSSSTQPHSVLLHESCYCNHRLAPDLSDQHSAWLFDILCKDAPLPTRPCFVLRGFPQKGPAHLLGVSPQPALFMSASAAIADPLL